ncbi:MAG: hypothetical protein WAN86_07680 [Hyphomicrobiaceae bacterium]
MALPSDHADPELLTLGPETFLGNLRIAILDGSGFRGRWTAKGQRPPVGALIGALRQGLVPF